MVFSTSFNGSPRYVATCITRHRLTKLVDTIVDTGAIRTCYMAHSIDPELREANLSGSRHKDFGGFVDGEAQRVRFYQYRLAQFTIGNVDMGARDIWITFDTRISDNVLGMDILMDVDFLQFRHTGRMYFFRNENELAEYVASRHPSPS